MNRQPLLCVLALTSALFAAACATSRSILPVRTLGAAPYYHSYRRDRPPEGAVIAHLPVRADATTRFMLEERSLDPLLDAMTTLLDSAGWTRRLDSLPRPTDEGPRVYVGSLESEGAPPTDSAWRAHVELPVMVVQAEEPTERWRDDLRRIAAADSVDFLVVVRVGLSEYVVTQLRPGLSAPWGVELGTEYVVDMGKSLLHAKQAQVLHFTGVLLAADGRVLRVGAEGVVAQKPNVLLSLFDVRSAISDEDVRTLLADHLREDLPGRPLVWQVALQNLVAQLLR